MATPQKIILFDGVCNLCNKSVQFILKKDKKKEFFFASLQGKTGVCLLQKFNLPENDLNSFLFVDNEKVYDRSTAALQVLRELGGVWKFFYVFMLVPKFVRDGIYKWIARNRYKWFGKRNECWLPTPELESRFLD